MEFVIFASCNKLKLFRCFNVKQKSSSKNSPLAGEPTFLTVKMTTRSQKRKAVAELVFGDFVTSVAENAPSENLVASSSKVPRVEPKSLIEIKTSLRKEIMSDLTKILAENQKEMLKPIAPLNKNQTVHMNVQDSDSEPENVSVTRTSTPVKIHTATNSKTTPVNSRNMVTGVLNDSTNQPTKRPKRTQAQPTKDRPSTSKILFAPQT